MWGSYQFYAVHLRMMPLELSKLLFEHHAQGVHDQANTMDV